MKAKILVTGIAGFIGFHLSKRLISRGYKIIGIDNLNDYYDPNLKKSRIKKLQKISEKKLNSFADCFFLKYKNHKIYVPINGLR